MVQHRETPDQAAVFEAYYAMGAQRSMAKLLSLLPTLAPDFSKKTPSLRTLKNWSSWFHWRQRIVIKDKAVADGIDKKTTKAIVSRKAELLELVDSLIDSSFERCGDGKLKLNFKIEKPRDLKEAVELALKLMGEPKRVEQTSSFEWIYEDDGEELEEDEGEGEGDGE
jgi:hypothetical protein